MTERCLGVKSYLCQPAAPTSPDNAYPPCRVSRLASVDEEQGIVWMRMNFGPGSVRGIDPVLSVWEMFKIYGGRIHAVEAFMETIPAAKGSGWDQ